MTALESTQTGGEWLEILHHRPLPAVLAFSAELGRLLEGQLDVDPFSR
jgi:hypothetical protein